MKKRFGLLFAVSCIAVLASCNNKTVEASSVAKTESTGGAENSIVDSTPVESSIVESSVPVELVMNGVAPSGAPSISLAYMLKNNAKITAETGYDATTLPTQFAKGEVDYIIAPLNMGANMYSKNGNYKLAAVSTWGNLYFASYKENFSISDLNNKTVYLFGENTINDVIVKYVLNGNNITCTKEYLGNTTLTKEKLAGDTEAICLVAEPVLTTLLKAKPEIKVISVQDLYKNLTNSTSYPQAGLFIKASLAKEKADAFIKLYEESVNKCSTDVALVAEICEELGLGKKAVLTTAIPQSNINFVKAKDAKAAIEKIYELAPKLFGGTKMVDEFYYE